MYAIAFDSLPLELAIKNMKGNGKSRIAVFTDPNCPYCNQLEQAMFNLTDATVNIFVYPILPGSEERANAIRCAPDRLRVCEDGMLKGMEPKLEKNMRHASFDKISMQAKKPGISLAPTLVFENGAINPGTMTLVLLEDRLSESSRKN